MAEATINLNAKMSVEVQRSHVTECNLVGEKATIALPPNFDDHGCNKILAYAKKIAYGGLKAKDSYGIVPSFNSHAVSKEHLEIGCKLDQFEIIAYFLNDDGKNESRRPQLEKLVDNMAEEISRIVVKHRDTFSQSKYGYLLRYNESGGW